jgi:hypothetical protein
VITPRAQQAQQAPPSKSSSSGGGAPVRERVSLAARRLELARGLELVQLRLVLPVQQPLVQRRVYIASEKRRHCAIAALSRRPEEVRNLYVV